MPRKELAGPIIPEFTSFLQGDRGNYNGAYLPPRSLGCPTSTLIAVLTDPAHPKNAKDDHSKMLTAMELMILSRWVDSNYQFYGSYFGRQHPQWVNPDPNVPAYDPARFPPQSDLRGSDQFPGSAVAPVAQARISFNTRAPSTPVSLASSPWNLTLKASCWMPSWCSIVACRSWTVQTFSTAE